MGKLIEGTWHDIWYESGKSGEFKREDAKFRGQISSNSADFKPESNRYVLFVSLACPWAHRTLIFRKLKGLEPHIETITVHWKLLENGWEFTQDKQNTSAVTADKNYLYQIYTHAVSNFTGRVTVPVLWDKKTETIVNNESSEIIRMFNSEFDELTGNKVDFYPTNLRHEIDEINEWIYHDINNGVYKSGFATSQQAHDKNVIALFNALDKVDEILASKRYLTGDVITEADWRLFTTLLRFDSVYNTHFKCTKKRIIDYPNIWDYSRHLFQMDGIADTVDWLHINNHYYISHTTINPTGIVPMMPVANWNEKTKR